MKTYRPRVGGYTKWVKSSPVPPKPEGIVAIEIRSKNFVTTYTPRTDVPNRFMSTGGKVEGHWDALCHTTRRIRGAEMWLIFDDRDERVEL